MGWRRLFFPSCESMTSNAKLEMSISKTKKFAKFAWIKVGQLWEKIQSSEGIFYFNSPWKRLILLSQTSKRNYYCKIVGNETSIKVEKSKKTLNISNRNKGSPINNGLSLTRVHANITSRDDVAQESHFRLMEFTFLQLGIMSNFLKLLQHKTYMVFMICHVLWENENVINVAHYKIIQVFTKHIIHQVLENNRCVGKAKRHHNIFEMAITCFEFCLPFITFLNMHQVVCPT